MPDYIYRTSIPLAISKALAPYLPLLELGPVAPGWYNPSSGAPLAQAPVNGYLAVVPWVVTKTTVIDSISANITVAGNAGSTLTFVVYNDAPGPGTLLYSTAVPITAAATGIALDNAINLTLTPGVYWVGVNLLGANVTAPTLSVVNGTVPPCIPIGTPTNITVAKLGYTVTTMTVPPPSPFPTPLVSTGLVPRLSIHVASVS